MATVIDTEDFPDAYDGGDVYDGDGEEEHPVQRLFQLMDAENIAELLDSAQLSTIGGDVVREGEIDDQSRADWKAKNAKAMKLALQVAETKNYPWPKAANIKYPLLTEAAIQFAARAYPAIVRDGNLVKSRVIGKDEDGKKRQRGERVSAHMSYQCLHQMEEWEPETDKMLHILPIAGLVYRKTYFDPVLGRKVSVMVPATHCIVNNNARSLETVPRITHEFPMYPYEIEERVRAGIFQRITLGTPDNQDGMDKEAPHIFWEQHRTLDLDEDGYAEPYIVTVHKQTKQVVRIVANFEEDDMEFKDDGTLVRIQKNNAWTKYGLFPNPDGGWHDIGFGYLLEPLNEAVNTTINQLLDAGHMSNLSSGFIGTGARLRGGAIRFRPGEWKPVNVTGASLRENLVPLPANEPSLVLFQLLGVLVEAGKDVSAIKDVMTGEGQSRNQSPTTTLALIEQGMQVFVAMYKRIFRSLGKEFNIHYKINSRTLDEEEYFRILDDEEAVAPSDYADGDYDIEPAADPTIITNMQRLGRAGYLQQFIQDPYIDPIELRTRLFEAAGVGDLDKLLLKQAPPNPMVAMEADKIDVEKRKLMLDEMELLYGKLPEYEAKILERLAKAEAAELGPQIQFYKQQLDVLKTRAQMIMNRERPNDGGGASRVPPGPDEQAISGLLDQMAGADNGGLGLGGGGQ